MTIDSSGNSGVDTRGSCVMLAANAMSSAPPLSVIVISQQGASRLAATISSIWEQRFIQPEIIVIDADSHRESAAWLDAHRDRLTAVLAGRAEDLLAAKNDAASRARGHWLLFLEAGDRLVGDMVLSETLNWMKKTEAGVVAGETAADDGRLTKLPTRVNAIARNFTPRAATFYRRSLFEENGGFDLSVQTMATYDFNLRLWKGRVRFKPIPLRITACAAEPAFDRRACAEEIRVRHRYFAAWRCWGWDALALLRCAKPGGRRER